YLRKNCFFLFPSLECGANSHCVRTRLNCLCKLIAGVVITHFLKQQDIWIQPLENICRRLYPLCLFFLRRFTSRAVWEPFQVPSCDTNLGWCRRLALCQAYDKEGD